MLHCTEIEHGFGTHHHSMVLGVCGARFCSVCELFGSSWRLIGLFIWVVAGGVLPCEYVFVQCVCLLVNWCLSLKHTCTVHACAWLSSVRFPCVSLWHKLSINISKGGTLCGVCMLEQLNRVGSSIELQLPVHKGPIGSLLSSLSRCYAIHTARLSIRPSRRTQRLAV